MSATTWQTDKRIDIKYKPLSVKEAIGTPEHDGCPIVNGVKGKAVVMAAAFNGVAYKKFKKQ